MDRHHSYPPNMKRKYNSKQLSDAINNAKSLRAVAIRLGLSVNGGKFYKSIRNACKENGIESDLLLKKNFSVAIHLKKNSKIGSSKLKRWLIQDGILKNECSLCGNQGTWQGKTLKIQLDHQNGNKTDNRLSNLRMLCPNCHSQTATYAGRNADQRKHWPDKALFEKNYRALSLSGLAEKYSKSLSTIKRWVSGFGLKKVS